MHIYTQLNLHDYTFHFFMLLLSFLRAYTLSFFVPHLLTSLKTLEKDGAGQMRKKTLFQLNKTMLLLFFLSLLLCQQFCEIRKKSF